MSDGCFDKFSTVLLKTPYAYALTFSNNAQTTCWPVGWHIEQELRPFGQYPIIIIQTITNEVTVIWPNNRLSSWAVLRTIFRVSFVFTLKVHQWSKRLRSRQSWSSLSDLLLAKLLFAKFQDPPCLFRKSGIKSDADVLFTLEDSFLHAMIQALDLYNSRDHRIYAWMVADNW